MSDMPNGLPIQQHHRYIPSISYHNENTNDKFLNFLTTTIHHRYIPSISDHNGNDISYSNIFPKYFPIYLNIHVKTLPKTLLSSLMSLRSTLP
jgi:hypothetical protein